MNRNSILLYHKYLFSLFILYLYIARIGVQSRKTSCSANEFHFELTECDATGGRWRVMIPNSSYGSSSGSCDVNLQDPRYAPTRINTCQLSCNAGYYFSVSNLTCSLCDPGTFSLGGGVLYDTWDTIPEAFHTQVESFQSSFSNLGRFSGDVNCSLYGWQPRGEYLASLGGPCAATLTYTVHLVKPGNLSYVYQYSNKDVIFDFEAQNEQCQSLDDSKEYRWPSSTRDGEWKKQVIQLKTGQNVLQWKTIGMESSPGKPIIIKSIEISGVAFTSSCTPCRNGTYSEGGSRTCTECPENHYSGRGARRCISCDPKAEVAPRGSARCVRRHACTQHDYFETRAPCDANNQTRKEYKWLDPKICRDDLPTAIQLPPPSAKHECSPCNPGMSYRNRSICEFCPPNFYSDGSGACHKCPPNTTPNYGYQFERWTELPKMMSTGCKEPDDYSFVTTGESSRLGCRGTAGWQLAGTHIHTGHQHAPGAYLLLSLDVPGFRSKGGVLGGRRLEAGRISFTFELDCKSKCEFVFMQTTESRGVTLIQSWSESKEKQEVSHSVLQNDSYTFSWAFQKVPLGESGTDLQERLSDALQNDVARIYAINVSNTIDGGAAICLPCHQDTEDRGCIPCPPGHFIDPNTTECTRCPPDTSVSNPLAYGEESCQPCGPGLSSIDGVSCTTNCVFSTRAHFDFTALAETYLVKGNRLFTASGAQYYHLFNISLCGKTSAHCSNNVSYQADAQNSHVSSFVCRTTIVPSQWAEEELVLSTQSVTLGDELVAVTKATSFMNMEVIEEFIDDGSPDELHFYYATTVATRSCPQGRSTVITLHCDPAKRGNGTIRLPTKCSDGTCDGCNFNFLWQTVIACPICTEEDFKMVKAECVHGSQMVHYLTPNHCRLLTDVPKTKTIRCTTHIPIELQTLIAATIALAIFLCALMVHFWRKTQRLEYKYMKLVQTSNNREDGELPPAESCALDDGEEEDIQFSQPRKQNLLYRIKSMAGKNESGDPFETIQLAK